MKKKKTAALRQPSPKPVRVLVGLPTYGMQPASVGDCFGNLRVLFAHLRMETAFLRIEDCPSFNHAMNLIISKFLSTPKVDTHRDRLLFLDNDVLFRAEDAWKIITSTRECLGADYAKRSPGAGGTAVYNGKRDGDLVGVVRMGTGFVCLDRELLERMNEKAKKYIWEGNQVPMLFEDCIVDDLPELGDVTFYRRLREVGEAWVDPTIRVGHVGSANYEIQRSPVSPAPSRPAQPNLRPAPE